MKSSIGQIIRGAVISLGVASLLNMAVSGSNAALVPVLPGMNDKFKFRQDWNWNFNNDAPNPSAVINLQTWHREVASTAGMMGMGPTLTLNIRHLTNPDGVNEIAPNPPDDMMGQPQFYTLFFNNIQRPGAQQAPITSAIPATFSHPNLFLHADLLYLRITVPNMGMVNVRGTGQHLDLEQVSANWSYNPFEQGTITVDASYETGSNRQVLGTTTVNPTLQPRLEGSLFALDETRRPTGYVVTFDPFTTGGTTELTLAFPGEVNGVPGRLDLAGGFELLTFAEELTSIVAPMFVDAAAMNPLDLFVSVDLAQWLSASTLYSPGQTFSIVTGTSEQLPGYLFSTSSTIFEPFEGLVRVAGNVDGASVVVPEPSSALGLLALGTLGVGSVLKRNKRQSTEKETTKVG